MKGLLQTLSFFTESVGDLQIYFDVDAVGDGRFAVLWIHFDTCFRSLRKDDLSKYQGGLRWCLQCLLQERRYKS